MFSVVHGLTYSLPRSFREAKSEYKRIETGAVSPSARWKTCTAQTNKNFEYATALLYVNAHLSEDARKRVRLNYSIGVVG